MAAVSIPHTEIINLHSERADADYQLWVASPVAGLMPLPDAPRKVLYILDANLFFGTAVEMSRLMSLLYGELPPLLVVGIAYNTDDPVQQAELRNRDFTPTVVAMPAFGNLREPMLPEDRRMGRAGEFRNFLANEVRPLIADRFDVAESGSTLFGSSLGGLFVLDAFLADPALFSAWIAVSPALWWDDGLLFKRLDAFLEARRAVQSKLFLAVGGEEERPDIPGLATFRMVTNLQVFGDTLEARKLEVLTIDRLIAAGETHTSVVPLALTRGLRFVHSRQP